MSPKTARKPGSRRSTGRAARRPPPIPREVVPSVARSDLSPAQVAREFRALLDGGARLRFSGKAQPPARLFALGHTPKHKIELFDTTFYLANVRQNPELRFMVAYIVQRSRSSGRPEIFPRIFYKDLSLVWRSASHFTNEDGLWVGKGDTYPGWLDGYEVEWSRESTTDLPIEMQTSLESLLRFVRRPLGDGKVIALLLREGPPGRVAPYRDFLEPRRRAAADPRNLVNGGRPVARFTRANDPTSLRFTSGYEPDFRGGILEHSRSRSRLYGGDLDRYRILSRNREIQYGFFAAPKHVWILPPQATTTELSSYGVRTIDVLADDDLFIPGYEYHYLEDPDDPDSLYTQIPEGFAGETCEHDPAKADASPWLDAIPVIREFRRKVLRRRG